MTARGSVGRGGIPSLTAVVPSPPIVIAAVRDAEWRAHVLTTIAGCVRLTFVQDVSELCPVAEVKVPDAALWHLSNDTGTTDTCIDAFRRLRRIAPRCRVIAYGQMDHALAPLLLLAGRVGVDQLLIRGFDDLERTIHQILDAANTEALIRETVTRLEVAPGRAMLTLTRCLRLAVAERTTVQTLANELRVNRKTVGVWLREAGLPSPEWLIGWCRVYWVAQLLRDGRKSIGHVARVLHFSSGQDLRRMVARYAGCTPTQLRDGSGVERLLRIVRMHRATRVADVTRTATVVSSEPPQ
jgi:AraC-like DNA-binding protein